MWYDLNVKCMQVCISSFMAKMDGYKWNLVKIVEFLVLDQFNKYNFIFTKTACTLSRFLIYRLCKLYCYL